MLRNIENANPEQIIKLLQNINVGIISMLEDYSDLYKIEEKKLFLQISKTIIKLTRCAS